MCGVDPAEPPALVLLRGCRLQADKLASLGGLGQEKSAKTRDDSTKLMNELVKNVADVLSGAQGALEAMRSRWVSQAAAPSSRRAAAGG